MNKCRYLLLPILLVFGKQSLHSQNTVIKGFVDVNTIYESNKVSFNLGEQDLFINSELNDRFTFLGETVFKFSINSPTTFDISIERVVLKYNFAGNHNLLFGKHHTPINYWNDTYHHGRVFFPTIGRPMLFDDVFIPLHTTGLGVQGMNFGDIKFGYDFLVGNGIGSNDFVDNDTHKSITAAIHIKPADGLRIGTSYYHDVISKGAKLHDGHTIPKEVEQQLFTGSVAYFGKKFEFLSEATGALDNTDSTGKQKNLAMYAYAGVRIKEKLIPYVRFDYLNYADKDLFFMAKDAASITAGIRYVINYLAVVKLEYARTKRDLAPAADKVAMQVAIGF